MFLPHQTRMKQKPFLSVIFWNTSFTFHVATSDDFASTDWNEIKPSFFLVCCLTNIEKQWSQNNTISLTRCVNLRLGKIVRVYLLYVITSV